MNPTIELSIFQNKNNHRYQASKVCGKILRYVSDDHSKVTRDGESPDWMNRERKSEEVVEERIQSYSHAGIWKMWARTQCKGTRWVASANAHRPIDSDWTKILDMNINIITSSSKVTKVTLDNEKVHGFLGTFHHRSKFQFLATRILCDCKVDEE